MARSNERSTGRGRSSSRAQRGRAQRPAEQGLIPVLAQVARDVERAVQRPSTRGGVRTRFQVVALLVREERARVMADQSLSDSRRTEQLKRLDGVATILATTAARDTSLLELLAEDASVSDIGASIQGDADACGWARAA